MMHGKEHIAQRHARLIQPDSQMRSCSGFKVSDILAGWQIANSVGYEGAWEADDGTVSKREEKEEIARMRER